MATLLSIFVVLRKDIFQIAQKPFCKSTYLIIVATIPTGIIALVLMPLLEKSFSGMFLPFCFLVSAILLMIGQHYAAKKQNHDINYKDAFLIGVFQGFATFPGISRSGATISGGLTCGCDKNQTAKFSFLISIPIIILSMLLEIYKICTQGVSFNVNVLGLIIAFFTAFLVGVASIKFMIKLTSKANLKYFSIYLIFVAFISIFI